MPPPARSFHGPCGGCAIIPDYPRGKLDIKLVIEHDDRATRLAIEALHLPATCEIVVAPAGWPRTKPRALNIALPLVRGELLVIFDAEDAPAPGQLREASERFLRAPRKLACLQARLAIDNIEDSWLTRLFAIEYAVLFDVLNPGLAGLGLPLPLGGSSNHFRTELAALNPSQRRPRLFGGRRGTSMAFGAPLAPSRHTSTRCRYNSPFAARIFSRKAPAISIKRDLLAVRNSSRAPSMANIASAR